MSKIITDVTRRDFVKLAAGSAAAAATLTTGLHSFPAIAEGKKGHVVIIGGGYGGAVAAKYIRMTNANIDVTLIEKEKQYVSCPLSNPVIVGLRDIAVQTWSYDGLTKRGVKVIHDTATDIDPNAKTVKTQGGVTLNYDKLIVSPGISLKWGAIEGYDEAASEAMPHGWKAGPQTLALKKMVAGMTDGEPFIIVAPANPFRCPPGPYERASLVAWYLQKHKPKSKVIILDAKDVFSKQKLFEGGWKQLGYNIEWRKGAEGGKVTRVDVKGKKVITDFGEETSSAINVIPPQQAGEIAIKAGLTDDKGWCPIDPRTCESTKHKNIFVIGDACTATPMPKSGYSANSEGKIAAAAIVAELTGNGVYDPSYLNTCYSLVAPDYGISVALIVALKEGKLTALSEGVSPVEASREVRRQEALYAESWYQSVMLDTLG
ncbi:MAG: FAD-dependent oxidoreductase [Magnetococcales bacterium]|nr:FAD-dependent oxidoreductase [Magnetococcales bacterium]